MSKQATTDLVAITSTDFDPEDSFVVNDGEQVRRFTGTQLVLWLEANAPSIVGGATISDFIQASDTPIDYTGQGGNLLTVNLAEDAVEFTINPGFLEDLTNTSITELSDVFTAIVPNDLDIFTYDGINARWISAPNSANTFIGATDTPISFVGQMGQGLVVNVAEDALEFIDIVRNISDLLDTPADFTGQAGNTLTVNVAEDGTIWAPPPVTPPITVVDNPLLADGFDVEANIVISSFESIGPTGSGAENIWAVLDVLPATTTHAVIRMTTQTSNSFGGSRSRGYWRVTSGVGAVLAYAPVVDTGPNAINTSGGATNDFVVALDGTLSFDVGYFQEGFGATSIYLVGYYAS